MTEKSMQKIKKVVKTACLALPLSALIFTAAWGSPNFRAFTSGAGGDYPLENVIFSDSEPNVLFYLDLSNRMLMSMRGMQPIAPNRHHGVDMDAYTRFPIFSDANLRVRMLEQHTFSVATRPISTPLASENALRAARRNPATHFSTPIALGSEGTGALRRWGRNVDWESGNKVIGHPYHFYSMDHTRPYMLTFRPLVLANWNGIWDGVNIDTIRDPAVMQWINQPGIPQARLNNRRRLFIDHIPGRDANGILRNPDGTLRLKPSVPREVDEFEARYPTGQFPTSDDLFYLVPNDSRLYAMKLALSRILAPEPENMEFLSRMRIGVATPFDEMALSGDFQGTTTHNFPFRRTDISNRTNRVVVSDWYRIHNGVDQYWLWHNEGGGAVGGGFQWITVPNESGIAPQGSDLPAGGATVTNQGQPTTRSFRMWRIASVPLVTLSRSVMHIPFDFMFHRVGNEFIPSHSLIQFREKIDGVQQYASTSGVGRVANAEFGISSTRASPETLMFASPELGPRRVVFAEGPAGMVYTTDQTGSSSGVIYSRIRNSEGLMTGTVAGTVLDFFSPLRTSGFNRTGALPFNAGQPDGTGDTRGFFPVTSACQPNWVIYFSTGNEANPGHSITDAGSMMHSLAQIANQSRQMRGRSWCYENNEWFERDFDMNYPIRTIIVGMVSTEGMELDGDPFANVAITDLASTARYTRNALRRIALAGQLIPDRFPNAVDGRPGPRRLDANGLPILRLYDRALDYYALAPMHRIQEPVPIFADNVPDLVRQLNETLANIRTGRQSSGAPRVEAPVHQDGDGDIVIFSASYELRRHTQWHSTFSRHILREEQRINPQTGQSYTRRYSVLDWEAGSMMQNAASAGLREARVFAVNAYRNESDTDVRTLQWLYNNDRLHSLTGTPSDRESDFLRWLVRYESISAGGTLVNDSGILGSMERFAPVFFPRNNPTTVFLQTNRGVVHSICYTYGTENWAFIPPPVFIERLWRNKFAINAVGAREWIDGDGIRMQSSQPLMLLDGMVHTSTDPGTGDAFLIGAMGLAGSGLYMMDITPRASNEPRFLWSVDNYRYETPNLNSVYTVGRSAAQAAVNYDNVRGWEYLGLTVAAPRLQHVGAHVLNPLASSNAPDRIVGIIPGGLGWNMGFDSQDNIDSQGRAFFVFDPINGTILRKMTNAQGFAGPSGAVLGMGITPVYYIPRDGRQAGRTQFFTGDSEGNILFLNMEDHIDNWALQTVFRVRTQADRANDSHLPDRAIALPRGFEVVWFNLASSRWLFAGTADLQGIGQETIQSEGQSGVTRQRALRNYEQYIFALNMGRLGRTSDDMPNASPAFGQPSFMNPTNPPGLDNLANIVYTECRDTFYDNNLDPSAAQNVGMYRYGWKMRLRDPGTDDITGSPTGAEFVSAAPHFNPNNGIVYVATFTPFVYDLCAQAGIARLYAFDATTGRNMWGSTDRGGHSIRFDNVKIHGISSITGSLFIGVSERVAGTLDGDTRLAGLFADGTVAEINVPANAPVIPDTPSHVRFFRETIH